MKKIACTVGLLTVLLCSSLTSFAFSTSDVSGSIKIEKKKCTITANCSSVCYNRGGSYWMSVDFRNANHYSYYYKTKEGTYGYFNTGAKSVSLSKNKSDLGECTVYGSWMGIVKDSNGSYLCGNKKECYLNW